MTKIALDLGDEDNEGEAGININSDYAQRYDDWRRREEIGKLKARIGSDESSSETSEEDVAEWTSNHERNFLHTLAALKTKDPKIYIKEEVFNVEPGKVQSVPQNSKNKSNPKPLLLKDYERKVILERGGIFEDSEEDDGKMEKSLAPSYYKQQEELKKQLKLALQDDDAPDDLLKEKKKSVSEIKKEDDEYYEWLKGRDSEKNTNFQELKGLKEIWCDDDKLDSDEKFLRDFLLEKKYEVDDKQSATAYEDLGVTTDDEQLEREQNFEHKFNFRFEEPDRDFIKQYPRSIPESLRRGDEKRKEKRITRKQRKCAEKQSRKEEIRELKALKRKEIEAKLEKLRELAGDDLNINVDDVEGEFDPAAYDKRMAELFSKEYYEKADDDEEKPCFSDDSDASDENTDFPNIEVSKNGSAETKLAKVEKNESCTEEPFTTKKKKRNAKFWNAVAKKKPFFDPDEKTFEEYYNEYYALDYEDIIGDTITRFKYRSVPANSFGLTNDEILNSDDKQLNAWASLKKVTAYRTDKEERYDILAYAKKALDEKKKNRVLNTDYSKAKSSLKGVNKKDGKATYPETSTKRTKVQLINAPHKNESEDIEEEKNAELGENPKRAKTRRKKKMRSQASAHDSVTIGIDDKRLLAYGMNPKKARNKIKYGVKMNSTGACRRRDMKTS